MNRTQIIRVVLLVALTCTDAVIPTIPASSISAQPSIEGTAKDQDGVKAAVFETPTGSLNVYLPDDTSAGDTISGTVVEEPVASKTPAATSSDEDTISGYVVDVQPKSPTPTEPKHCTAKTPDYSCIIPPICTAVVVSLYDRDHHLISTVDMPCLPTPPPQTCAPNETALPKKGTCGKPLKVRGRCDGKFDNSSILIGKKKCRMLAESPRQQICLSPIDIIGTTQIECTEGTRHAIGTFENTPVPPPKSATPKSSSDLNGQWMMTGSAEGHASTMPVTISHQGNSVNWTCADTSYTGTISGTTLQFTMTGTYWSGSGTLTLSPSGTLDGTVNYTYKQNGAPGSMTISMTKAP